MKKVFLLFCLLVCSNFCFAKHEIKYEVSPLGNLVYQLDCMAQIAHFRCSVGDFMALWQDEIKPKNEDQSLLAEWGKLRTSLNKNVNLKESPELSLATSPNFPINETSGLNVLEQVRIMAFAARSEADYERVMGMWLPFNYVESELAIIKHFKPRFNQWFEQQQTGLAEFVSQAEALSQKVDLDGLLTQMRTFYRSEIPTDLVLPVYLIAHPKKQASSSGLVFNQNSLIEVLKGEKAKDRLGVVVHEIAHFYHSRAPLDWHQQVMKYFTDSDSETGKVGYYLYNEALAAAIGNGLFESMANEPDYFKKYIDYPMSFYADEGIDTAAKAALPLVKKRLKNEHALDDKFLADLDLVWSQALKDIKDTPRQRLRHAGLVILDAQYDDMINDLLGIIRPSSAQMNTSPDLDNKEPLIINQYPKLDSVILASDAKQLESLNISGLSLKSNTTQQHQIVLNTQGTARLVIVSNSKSYILETLSKVLEQETFRESTH